MSADPTIPCPECNTQLAVAPGTAEVSTQCPQCRTAFDAYFFPAFFRGADVGITPVALVDNSEASCFYHPAKQAVGVCDGCGRLVCALCAIDLGSEHLCPNCISSGKKKGKLTTLEDHRTRWDSIAMSLAMGSLFVYVFSIFLAPAAIYIAIRHWNSPGSLLGVSKTRFVIAVILATGALVLWISIFGAILFFHNTPIAKHH